ncbi:S8 family serine peptidase, partial [Dactylosporangium fulvum]|uniref:S8 family serine peptidase n=1 Tax=Dactylosporangium fulvum TaxID=53359 RepID=UPI0031CED9A3
MPRRARLSGSAILLALAGCLAPLPAAAHAPPACSGPLRPPQPAPTGTPWPQQRYDQRRLAPLADGHGVIVAVIDSGVDARHPQLRGAVQSGTDQLDGGGSVLDCVGHGTGVAGIIAARPAGGVTFRGLAPAATILALRVSELIELEDGTTAGRRGTAAGLAAAIRDAVGRGAKVINLSLVSYRDEPEVREAVRFAISRDVVLVAAAGNRFEEGNPTPYPAAYDGVVGVGAIDPDGRRVPSSQTGPHVDLVAPGAQIVTTATPQGLTVADGTSFAVPFVAATAALLRQYRPELSGAEVAA